MKEIPLTKGKVAIVDKEDFKYLSQFRWHISTNGYAVRTRNGENGRRHEVFMHREIIDCPKGKFIDHINRTKLDNRKCNLRVATSSQNGINRGLQPTNTSGYKGVSYHKKANKWQARLSIDGKLRHLGCYETKEEAAKAYNVKAEEVYGEFAFLNEVDHRDFKIKLRQKTSRYKGVCKVKKGNKWSANIVSKGEIIFLGNFDSEADAARMYNFWAIDLFGENAVLNKIQEVV